MFCTEAKLELNSGFTGGICLRYGHFDILINTVKKVSTRILNTLMVKTVGVKSADAILLNQKSFGQMENVPPSGLCGGPRQWVWVIKSS